MSQRLTSIRPKLTGNNSLRMLDLNTEKGRRFKSGPFGYSQAKALVYSKYGDPNQVLFLHQHSISPLIPPNSLLLRTLASPINPADINQIQGVYPSRSPFTPFLGTPEPSAVGGNEGCFEVVSIGSSVKESLSQGDWVIMKNPGCGTWRTHAIVDSNNVLRVDKKGLTPTQVGTVSINPCTAYRMLKDFVELHDGDWWMQNGANSGVGRSAIQLGKLWGFRSINVIRDRTDPKLTSDLRKELLDLGATHVITENELLDRKCRDRVMEWTNGGKEKIKLGLNCVGGKPATALVKCLSKEGYLVTYGNMSRQPLQLPASRLIFDNLRFGGFWVSRWAAENPTEKQCVLNEILDLIREGSLKDIPLQELRWDWDTDEQSLKGAIRGSLDGFRDGKGIFVYGET